MTKFFFHFLFFILSLLVIFVATHSIIYFLPGNPIEAIIAETGTKIPVEEISRQYHLDRSFGERLLLQLTDFFQGHFKRSILTGEKVSSLIWEHTFNTLLLSASALFFSFFLSLLLSVFASGKFKHSTFLNQFCKKFSALSAAMPTPWVGPIFIYLFCVFKR